MSEWLKIMMAEIARRRAEQQAARLETERRAAERARPVAGAPATTGSRR